jgi:oxygen-independent coproporphyrinogen-3 oxidase
MGGIYLHIPFCKQACSYCNFHFSTLIRYKEEVLKAMHQELEMRKSFFSSETIIESIYFGGGTPSLLTIDEINGFIQHIQQLFSVGTQAEITLEANPDDLTKEYLIQIKEQTIINRFSIGVQSFHEEDLQYMNRAHHASEALQCIQFAKQIGFHNLSIDLIYGTPTMNDEQWRQNLHTAFALDIPHISCYALTVEGKTALESEIKKHKKTAPTDERMVQQFSILLEEMQKHQYLQYEISNFCKEDFFAFHNTNYWKGIPYLGIGPSAHSYDGKNRYWNIANNTIYTQKIIAKEFSFETENLSKTNRYNEYIMTAIRTMYGVNSEKIKNDFGEEYLQHFMLEVSPFMDNKWIKNLNNIYTLTNVGKLFCDYISENLFIIED